jgi:hypothetical protein
VSGAELELEGDASSSSGPAVGSLAQTGTVSHGVTETWFNVCMAMSGAERQRNYRERNGARVGGKRGPLATEPCGTPAGARRHERAGEPVCDECKAAEAIRQQQRRAAAREAGR